MQKLNLDQVKSFIIKKLKNCGYYDLSSEDFTNLDKIGLESLLYKKITSKKFRKWSVDKESETKVKQALKINIGKNEPLKFTFPFGGYKLWRLPSAPEVDWAEFFTIAYYSEYLAPIAKLYKPGAILSFSSDDIIIERMDNISTKDTNSYFQSFVNLLKVFRKYLPKNLIIDIVRVADFFDDKSEYESELNKNIKNILEKYPTWDKVKKEKMIKSSKLNICWNGSKNLTKIPEVAKQKIISMGPIYHDAHCAISRRRTFVRGEDKIVIFTTPISNSISLGTTQASVTKFWTGIGVLEKRKDAFVERILSPSQIEKVKKIPYEEIPLDIIKMNNFSNIKLYLKTLDL